MELQKTKVLTILPAIYFQVTRQRQSKSIGLSLPGDTNNCWAAVSHANPTGTLPPSCPLLDNAQGGVLLTKAKDCSVLGPKVVPPSMRFQAIAGATGTPCPAEPCVPVMHTGHCLCLANKLRMAVLKKTVSEQSLY